MIHADRLCQHELEKDHMKLHFIRTDGTEDTIDADPASDVFGHIEHEIGAKMLDSVNLRDGRVMFVDDHGYETKEMEHAPGYIEVVPVRALKPVNEKATALYHAVCRPGVTHRIVGDVCIVVDKEFEG